MDLEHQLLDMLHGGFSESLFDFFKEVFSSYEYSDENLPKAGLYLHALRLSMQLLSSDDEELVKLKASYVEMDQGIIGQEGLWLKSDEVSSKKSCENEIYSIALRCYKDAVKKSESAEFYSRLFVTSWCRHFSDALYS